MRRTNTKTLALSMGCLRSSDVDRRLHAGAPLGTPFRSPRSTRPNVGPWRYSETSNRTWCREGTAMTILDFKEQRVLRRQAERDRWFALMDRKLAELQRMADLLLPIVEQWLAQKKVRPRRPRCEAPRVLEHAYDSRTGAGSHFRR